MFSAMIPQAEGTTLIETVKESDPMQGALVPMNCNKHAVIGDKNQQCLPAVKADRDLVDGLALVRTGGKNDEVSSQIRCCCSHLCVDE